MRKSRVNNYYKYLKARLLLKYFPKRFMKIYEKFLIQPLHNRGDYKIGNVQMLVIQKTGLTWQVTPVMKNYSGQAWFDVTKTQKVFGMMIDEPRKAYVHITKGKKIERIRPSNV